MANKFVTREEWGEEDLPPRTYSLKDRARQQTITGEMPEEVVATTKGGVVSPEVRERIHKLVEQLSPGGELTDAELKALNISPLIRFYK